MTVSAEDTVQVTYVWGVYNTNSSSDSNVFVENSVVTVTKGEVIPETDIPLMDATKYHNGFYVSDWKTASGNSWDFEFAVIA